VIDFLSVNDKGDNSYKVQCVFDEDHDDKTLKVIPDRVWAVRRSIDVGDYNAAEGTVYFCDICRCREGEYGWMFRYKKRRDCQYEGHDVCFRCVYDMIKKYNQLYGLLIECPVTTITLSLIQPVFNITTFRHNHQCCSVYLSQPMQYGPFSAQL